LKNRVLVTAIGVALILLGSVFLASVFSANVPLTLANGLVDVRVVDLSGNSVAGASVSVIAYYGAPLTNGVTGSDGVFSFNPDVVTSPPALITVTFNGYTNSAMWYSGTWETIITLNFNSATPTPSPVPTAIPTATQTPTPTPTAVPTPTPIGQTPTPTPIGQTPTPQPTSSVIPIPIVPIHNTPINSLLVAVLGAALVGSGAFCIWLRKFF
jgi:hypothetical protein